VLCWQSLNLLSNWVFKPPAWPFLYLTQVFVCSVADYIFMKCLSRDQSLIRGRLIAQASLNNWALVRNATACLALHCCASARCASHVRLSSILNSSAFIVEMPPALLKINLKHRYDAASIPRCSFLVFTVHATSDQQLLIITSYFLRLTFAVSNASHFHKTFISSWPMKTMLASFSWCRHK